MIGRVLMAAVAKLTGNATPGDVVAGATFYSDDPNEKQTGTLELTGNAPVNYVLEGRTFYSKDPKTKQTGTMTSRGAWTATIDPGESVTIPIGFHNGQGKVTANAGGYPGYQLKKGEIGKLSQTNNQTLSGTIPAGIIPLTLKFTHANTTSDWPVYLGLTNEPFAYAKGNVVGASRAGMTLFYDLEMAYGGISEIQKYTHYGCHTTNTSGTNTLSIVKWLEPIA